MRLCVKVKANAKFEKVEQIGAGEFTACVKAPALEGKANAALVKLFSEYFDIPKSRVIIIKGSKGKNKLVDLLDYVGDKKGSSPD